MGSNNGGARDGGSGGSRMRRGWWRRRRQRRLGYLRSLSARFGALRRRRWRRSRRRSRRAWRESCSSSSLSTPCTVASSAAANAIAAPPEISPGGVCKPRGRGRLQRRHVLQGRVAGQGCRAGLQGRVAGPGCRARLEGRVAGPGCRARLQGRVAGPGCRAGLQGQVARRHVVRRRVRAQRDPRGVQRVAQQRRRRRHRLRARQSTRSSGHRRSLRPRKPSADARAPLCWGEEHWLGLAIGPMGDWATWALSLGFQRHGRCARVCACPERHVGRPDGRRCNGACAGRG